MEPPSPYAIQVQGLCTAFGQLTVHENLDLDVRRGEVIGVVGASGSGKSVLLRALIGLQPITAGTVRVLDIDLADSAAAAALRQRWGVLFQGGALFSSLTIAENVQLPLNEYADIDLDLCAELAAMKIALAGLPPEVALQFPSALSGGMRKRAGLARALALDPELLFLDEPTAGLDPISAAAFDALLRRLHQALGLTVFMITHDLDSLYALCDRVAVLADKKVIAVGSIEELTQNPHPWIQDYFLGPRGRQMMRHKE